MSIEPKIIEQRKVMKVSCYKWEKFKFKDPERAKCPWGYIEINPLCQNCVWFTVSKVNAESRALVFDREIEPAQVPGLLAEWQQLDAISRAAPCDQETIREEIGGEK